jgi:hypothetical protein
MLGGWLHRATCFVAAKVVRGEQRRQVRERQAAEMSALNNVDTSPIQIGPLLDEAINELGEEDRKAILLRFYEQKDFRAVGEALGSSENAAQKRVSRALDQLRLALTARGVAVPAATLGGILAAEAATAAPAGLAASIAGPALAGALAGATLGSGTATTLINTLFMSKLKLSLLGAALALGTGALLIQQHRANNQLRAEVEHLQAELQQQKLALVDQVQQLQRERDEATNQLASLAGGTPRLGSDNRELLRLRGEVTRLRNVAADPAESEAKGWKARMDALKQRLEQTPAAGIPEFRFLSQKDWLDVVKDNPLATEKDYRETFSKLRFTAESIFGQKMQKAMKAYAEANSGAYPNELSQLQPYFESQVEDALLQRYEILPAQSVKSITMGGNWIITLKSPVDLALDDRLAFGPNGMANFAFIQAREIDTLLPAMRAFSVANQGQAATDPVQLRPYVKTPEEEAALQRVLDTLKLQ